VLGTEGGFFVSGGKQRQKALGHGKPYPDGLKKKEKEQNSQRKKAGVQHDGGAWGIRRGGGEEKGEGYDWKPLEKNSLSKGGEKVPAVPAGGWEGRGRNLFYGGSGKTTFFRQEECRHSALLTGEKAGRKKKVRGNASQLVHGRAGGELASHSLNKEGGRRRYF